MAEPVDFQKWRRDKVGVEATPGSVLKDGNGDGTSGGMEARVAKLEAHVEHIRTELGKLSGLPTDLAVLKTRVDHLPTKGFIITSALTTVTAVVGLLTLLARMGILAAH